MMQTPLVEWVILLLDTFPPIMDTFGLRFMQMICSPNSKRKEFLIQRLEWDIEKQFLLQVDLEIQWLALKNS